MTHDPLCPYFPEQQGFGGIDSGVPSTQPYIRGVPCQCDLIARVREDEAQGQSEALLKAQRVFLREGYAAALRDSVEAVKAVNPGVLWRVDGYDAVAAIEALGGER